MFQILNKFYTWLARRIAPIIRKWVSVSFFLALGITSVYYLKLVDVAENLQDSQEIPKNGEETNNLSIGTPRAETNGNTRTASPEPELIISQRPSINNANYAKNRIDTLHEKGYSLPFILGMFVFGMVVFFIVLYLINQRSIRNHILVLQEDPPQLSDLFDVFGRNIAELRTPRKVKKLVNKIRFQFNLLDAEQLLITDLDQKVFFHVSIAAEMNSEVFKDSESLEKEINHYKAGSADKVTSLLLERILQINQTA